MIPLGPITLQTSDKSVKALARLEMKSMSGREELGRPFEYELELLSTDTNLDLAELLGKPMTVRLELTPLRYRYWNGIVTDVGFAGSHGRHALYRLTLRPRLSLLERTSNCRIFQNQSVPTIVKAVIQEHGFSAKESLSGHYASREFVVQYEETDFHFVSRLLEQEGIYYFFRHEEEQHELVLSDAYSAHATQPGYESLPYFPPDVHRASEIESIDRWELQQRLVSAGYVAKDYDFERPLARPESVSLNDGDRALKSSEVFDYAGAYLYPKQAEEDYKAANNETQRDLYARVRMEEGHASFERIVAHSNARGLVVGSLFTLTEFPRPEQNREYLIVSSQFELRAHELESAGAPVEEPFRCRIGVLHSRRPFRPKRIAAKPLIRGPQTAIIVGPDDDEIWTDQYGRVKVQFHWDRLGEGDENSSCWVRVAQIWAGSNWGGIHIPRIGQEVIVEFLEGDPDRPIITGRVYNRDNMPPYELPANQTQSGIKSRSSKGGAASNFNEIRFEDLKGKEELFIQAERNQTTKVKQAQSISVGASRSKTVGADETITVNGKRTTHVVKKDTVNLDDEHEMTVKLKVTETFKDDHKLTITGKQETKIDKDKTEHVVLAYELTTDKKFNLTQGATSLTFEGNAVTLDAAGPVTIKRGPATVSIDAAGKISISTPVGISLECGPSSMTLSPSGIELSAAKVAVSAAASSLELSPATAKLSSAVTTVEATTICNVKGMAMLNLNSG
ncbi:MAG TPA: type VI secretion system tip protein VgrG [Polyangiaceae bacterium]|nr:type VI secretion system tip protein VgrG [Polyangiaceae bacterium]